MMKIKTIISGLLVSVALIISITNPIIAAPAGDEQWHLGGAFNGQVNTYIYVNPNNLQWGGFSIVNNSSQTIHLFVRDNGVIVYELIAEPYTTVEDLTNFPHQYKFHRLPANDPDDPNSVRYPNGVTIGSQN